MLREAERQELEGISYQQARDDSLFYLPPAKEWVIAQPYRFL